MSVPTTINSLEPPVQQWLDKVLLARPEPNLIHTRFAYQVLMPSKAGRIARFRRYTNLATATVPLTDGVTPPPQSLSALNIDAQVDWYGSYVILTDQLTLQIQDPILNETASLLAQSMRETHDESKKSAHLKPTLIVLKARRGNKGEGESHAERLNELAA